MDYCYDGRASNSQAPFTPIIQLEEPGHFSHNSDCVRLKDECHKHLVEDNVHFWVKYGFNALVFLRRVWTRMETPLDVLSRAASLVHQDDEKRESISEIDRNSLIVCVNE